MYRCDSFASEYRDSIFYQRKPEIVIETPVQKYFNAYWYFSKFVIRLQQSTGAYNNVILIIIYCTNLGLIISI